VTDSRSGFGGHKDQKASAPFAGMHPASCQDQTAKPVHDLARHPKTSPGAILSLSSKNPSNMRGMLGAEMPTPVENVNPDAPDRRILSHRLIDTVVM
jgi:hypothetical protein